MFSLKSIFLLFNLKVCLSSGTTPKSPDPLPERKIIILGRGATGKSTLANVLIGQSPYYDCSTMSEEELSRPRNNRHLKNQSYYDVGACVKDLHTYKVSSTTKSATMKVEANPILSDGTYPPFLGNTTHGIGLKCIDTPGLWFDGRQNDATMADNGHIYKINKFYNEDLEITGKGVDAFVFVMKHDRWLDSTIVELLENLTRGFGVSFWDNCIIVMTHLRFKYLDYSIVNVEERLRKFKDGLRNDYAPFLMETVHKIIYRNYVYADDPEKAKDKYDVDFFKQRMVFIDSYVKILQAKSKVKAVRNIDHIIDEQLPLFEKETNNFLTLLNELHKNPYNIPMVDVKTRYEREKLLIEENECLKNGMIFNAEEKPGSKRRCMFKPWWSL